MNAILEQRVYDSIPTIPPYFKRITAELNDVLNFYEDINISRKQGGPLIITVMINKHKVRMYIPESFPFKPPRAVIGMTGYQTMLSTHYKNILKQIISESYKIFPSAKECMCCNTVLCSDIWSPAIRISHLLKEIHDNIIIKKRITDRYIANTFLTRNKINCSYIPYVIIKHIEKFL